MSVADQVAGEERLLENWKCYQWNLNLCWIIIMFHSQDCLTRNRYVLLKFCSPGGVSCIQVSNQKGWEQLSASGCLWRVCRPRRLCRAGEALRLWSFSFKTKNQSKWHHWEYVNGLFSDEFRQTYVMFPLRFALISWTNLLLFVSVKNPVFSWFYCTIYYL